jgi:peptide-methionine (R)-S-oxide reductase
MANDLFRLARRTLMIDRRILLASVAGLFGLAGFRWLRTTPAQAAEKFEVEKTDAEWRAQLTPQQYEILRKEGTERPGSSPLLKEHRKGVFACAGCDLPLFSSETKFESGTGWPSFFRPLPHAVATALDRSLLIPRTEVHCRRCGGHLGHVFHDGPPPTGLRYCMNGVALTFRPAEEGTG